MIIWERPLSWHAKCSLPVNVSKNRAVIKLFSNRSQKTSKCGKNKKVAHKPLEESLFKLEGGGLVEEKMGALNFFLRLTIF